MNPWLTTISDGHIGLRPIRQRDIQEWRAIRSRNYDWLMEWEATSPLGVTELGVTDLPPYPSYRDMVRQLRREARAGQSVPWLVTFDGRMVGQVTFGGIALGSIRSAYAGYWIDRAFAGQGVVPTALALGIDHCWKELGLHRIEINIRPENVSSRRVVDKLGFRYEGLRQRYLHIAGQWRDHLSYALTVDEVPGGMLARWKASRQQR